MPDGKVMIMDLIVGSISYCYTKMRYFPGPYIRSKNKIKVELDLSNYATKSDLKKAKGVDTTDFAKKYDLAGLKSEIDKLDICKLETNPADLTKPSNIVENVVQKMNIMNWLRKLMLFRLLVLVI